MVIIDEISFASKQDISTMHRQLSRLKQKIHSCYGGINIVFSGDFRQLEPVGQFKKPIYADSVPEFTDWINCFIELNGIWRYKSDLPWGNLLSRMRDGNMSNEDVAIINSQIQSKRRLPSELRYATFFNVDRDAINTAIFEERAKNCFVKHRNTDGFIIIFSDNITIKTFNKVYRKFSKPSLFWEKCGENDIILPRGAGRMDPVLKLYIGCRIMLPTNINVADGMANGTQARVMRIVLKPGVHISSTNIAGGIPISAVFASQVEYLVLQHLNTRIIQTEFKIYVKQQTFKTRLPTPFNPDETHQLVEMRACQLPILVNNATTGHKLQGSGVEQLFVHNWSYTTNWPYVMLSRVKTLSGLYARNTIDTNLARYTPNSKYHKMILQMRSLKPYHFSDDEYKTIQNGTLPELRLM
jgi:PIF1-like helicase